MISMIAYVVQDPQASPFKLKELRWLLVSCELQITNYKFTIDLPRPSFFLVFLVCSDLILQPLEGQEREEVPYGTILHINFYRKCFIKCISKFFLLWFTIVQIL